MVIGYIITSSLFWEAGFLRSQISQQVVTHPFAEVMDTTAQRPQLRNLG